MDTLFSNVTCVTMDDNMRVLTDAFVGVKDGKIAYIGQTAPEAQPQKIIDGTGMVLMPGLINCHTHLPMTTPWTCGSTSTSSPGKPSWMTAP